MSSELPPQSEELNKESTEINSVVDSKAEKKLLVLALIVGMSVNAILSSILTTEVNFSIFPLITMVLASQFLYQIYLHQPLAEDTPLVGLACFFLGIFGYAAYLKATHPAMGTNFFSIIICIALIFWIGKKQGVFNR